jgi:hypothetical protein
MEMKITKYIMAATLAAMVVACSSDDVEQAIDNGQPKMFNLSCNINGETRTIGGKDAWTGDGTELLDVYITFNADAAKDTGVYSVTNASGATSVVKGIYWPSVSTTANVVARYPAGSGDTVCISHQENGFKAFDYLYGKVDNVAHKADATITFTHKMAKLCVIVPAFAETDVSMQVPSDTLVYFASDNTVKVPEDAITGYIEACPDVANHAFELLLPPQTIAAGRTIYYRIGEKNYRYTLTGNMELTENKVDTLYIKQATI